MMSHPHILHPNNLSQFELFFVNMTDDLLRRALSFWSVPSLISLGASSVMLRGVYKRYCADVWNINRRLRTWFPNPALFRKKLRDTGAIISGSQALQYFDREQYEGSDLDIYVSRSGAILLGHWLEGIGYKYHGKDPSYDFLQHLITDTTPTHGRSPFHSAIMRVHNFHRFLICRRGVARLLRVQLIVLEGNPVVHIMFDFHSSK